MDITAPKDSTIQHTFLENTVKQILYIQRSSSPNTVVYDLNFDEQGNINKKDPVDIYWRKFSRGGERKDLNYIQRRFAYGLKVKQLDHNKYQVKFVSYDKFVAIIQKSYLSDEFSAIAEVNGKEIELRRIFIIMEEGESMWFPKIEAIVIEGVDPYSGIEIKEKITP